MANSTAWLDWTTVLFSIPEMMLLTFPLSAPLCFYCGLKMRSLLSQCVDEYEESTSQQISPKSPASTTSSTSSTSSSTSTEEEHRQEQIDAQYKVALMVARRRGLQNVTRMTCLEELDEKSDDESVDETQSSSA